VIQLPRLLGNRLTDLGPRMTVDVHPPRGDSIQNRSIILQSQVRPACRNYRQYFVMKAMLRIGMPKHFPIA
jgi:hypothetical protein